MFGMVGTIDLNTYVSTGVPAPIAAYVGGSYLPTAQPGRRTLAWSVKWPGADSNTRALTLDYEKRMFDLAKSVVAEYRAYKPGDSAFKKINDVKRDIDSFKEYLTIRNQDLNDELTMSASTKALNEMWGDYDTFLKIQNWILDQSKEATQVMLDEGRILMADAISGFSSAKIKFYREKIIPLKNKFSQGDQGFLRDVFLYQTDGTVKLDDLVKALKMLKPHLSFADLGQVLMFATQMVLGSNMASDTLNTSSTKSYYDRNINAEVAEITSKYNAVAGRLGSWLKPETNALFQERLNIHRLGYANPNDPKYYVCGEVCNTISKNFIDAVVNAVSSIVSGSSMDSAASKAISDSVQEKIESAVKSGMSIDEATALGKKLAAEEAAKRPNISAGAQANDKGGFSGFLPLLIGGAALWLLFGGKNNDTVQ